MDNNSINYKGDYLEYLKDKHTIGDTDHFKKLFQENHNVDIYEFRENAGLGSPSFFITGFLALVGINGVVYDVAQPTYSYSSIIHIGTPTENTYEAYAVELEKVLKNLFVGTDAKIDKITPYTDYYIEEEFVFNVVINGKLNQLCAIPNTEKVEEIKGWYELDNNIYYFKDNAYVTGFQTIDGYKYYFNDEGIMQKGITIIGEDYYFLGEYSGKMQKGFITSSVNGNTYYAKTDGKLVKGPANISNGEYYFDQQTGELLNDFKEIDGYTYYFVNGVKQLGITNIEGEYYFLGEYSGRLIKGWVTSSLTGNIYYGIPSQNGKLATGTININGTNHNFNEEGILIS